MVLGGAAFFAGTFTAGLAGAAFVSAGAALAGAAFLAAGLAGVRAAAGLAEAFVAAVLGAATFFGVVVREVPGDALEDVTEVEVAFLVVSGFLRNRSTRPPSPLRGDSAGAGDFAPLALATGLIAGAGFDVAMGDLVQCVEGSRKTLVKFLGGKTEEHNRACAHYGTITEPGRSGVSH